MAERSTALSAALRAATLAVLVDTPHGRSTGSGWFVRPDLVATCAHVVADKDGTPYAQTATGRQGEHEFELAVVPELIWPYGSETDVRGPDVALLKVSGRAGAITCALVCADTEIGDDLWSYGYPAEGEYRSGDSVSLSYEGRSQLQGGGELLKVTHGQVRPGLSGSPVLNWRTGGVCAMVRTSRDRDSNLGARLTPVTEIVSRLPHTDPPSNPSWLAALNRSQLATGGWNFPSPELPAYVNAVLRRANEHPYAVVLDDPPSLHDMYVWQKIQEDAALREPSGLDRPSEAPDRMSWVSPADSARDDQTDTLTGPEARMIPAIELLKRRQAVIIGGPGTGKSTLLNYLASTAASSWLASLEAGSEPTDVPVLVPARRLASARGRLVDSLTEIVGDELSEYLDTGPLPADFFQRPPTPHAEWLVLVDGLDEVLDARQRRLLREKLRRELMNGPCYRVLMTTRPLPLSELMIPETRQSKLSAESRPVRLLPFDSAQLSELVRGWFRHAGLSDAEAEADRFVTRLATSSLQELCRTPLLAAMACAAHMRHPDQELPSGRTTLYRDFVDALLNSQERRLQTIRQLHEQLIGCVEGERTAAWLFDHRTELLEYLATAWDEHGTGTLTDLALRRVEEYRPRSGMTDRQWRILIRALLIRTGVLTAQGDDLAFTHRTYQDYLSASATARTMKPTDEQAVPVLEHAMVHDRDDYALFLTGSWAAAKQDLSALANRMISLGQAHTRMLARMIGDGIPLPTVCIQKIVIDLRLQLRGRLPSEAREAFELIAPYLPRPLVTEMAGARDLDGQVRVTLLRAVLGTAPPETVAPMVREIATSAAIELEVRAAAAALLASIDGPAVAAALLVTLAGQPTVTDGEQVEVAKHLLALQAYDDARTILERVIADGDIPTAISAAQTLANFDRDHASARIRDLAALPCARVYDRHTCADVLADLDERDSAITIYRQVLTEPASDSFDRQWSATQLAKLGLLEEAVTALRAIANDRGQDGSETISAAEELAKLGYADEAAGTLQRVMNNPGHRLNVRLRATRALGMIGDPAEAVGVLLGYASRFGASTQQDVAEALVELRATSQATELLSRLATDRRVPAHLRTRCAMDLADLDHLSEAAEILTSIINDESRDPDDRAEAVEALCAFRRDSSALKRMWRTVADPNVGADQRIIVTKTLLSLTDDESLVDHLRLLAFSSDVSPDNRVHAAETLSEIGLKPDAMIAAFALLIDSSISARVKTDAARILGPGYRPMVLQTLHQLIQGPDVPENDAITAIDHLKVLCTCAAYELAVAVAVDHERSPNIRAHAALAARWINQRSLPTEVLIEIVNHSDLDADCQYDIANELLDYGLADQATTVLAKLVDTGSTPAWLLTRSAEKLAALGHHDKALGVVRNVFQSPDRPTDDRIEASYLLTRLSGQDEVTGVLQSIARSTGEDLESRLWAASGLIWYDRAAEALALVDKLLDAADRVDQLAAVALFLDGIEDTARAIDLHRKVLSAASVAPSGQVIDSVRALCAYGHDAEVITFLDAMVKNASPPISELIDLLVSVANANHTAFAAAKLRQLADNDALTISDRMHAAAGLGKIDAWQAEASIRVKHLASHPVATDADRALVSGLLAKEGDLNGG